MKFNSAYVRLLTYLVRRAVVSVPVASWSSRHAPPPAGIRLSRAAFPNSPAQPREISPSGKRVKLNGKKNPWSKADQKKTDLLKRLREAEQQQDFFSGLYRQYTTNLLKLVIYVRSLVNNPQVRKYLEEHHPQRLELWEEIIRSTEH
jgi:hypothetical protein